MKRKIKRFVLRKNFSRGKFCVKVLFKMTGLLKYLYQSSLIKIDISLKLPYQKGFVVHRHGNFSR